jgi:hypothetical protein
VYLTSSRHVIEQLHRGLQLLGYSRMSVRGRPVVCYGLFAPGGDLVGRVAPAVVRRLIERDRARMRVQQTRGCTWQVLELL